MSARGGGIGTHLGIAVVGCSRVGGQRGSCGAVADMRINHGLGGIFQASFGLGCFIAACVARRSEMFGSMLQPPLILGGIALPVVLLWLPAAAHGSLMSRVITTGLPVIDNFPLAAATTVVTILIGAGRMALRRKPIETGIQK